jgi:hypothetical protein
LLASPPGNSLKLIVVNPPSVAINDLRKSSWVSCVFG